MCNFKVGQQVICINNITDGSFIVLKKNQIYTIKSIENCSKCGNLELNIGIMEPKGIRCHCGRGLDGYKGNHYKASRFVPILDNFKTISFEKVLEEESILTGVN